MESQITTERDVIQYKKGEFTSIRDGVVLEFPLTVFIDGEEYITLVCSPDHLEEMIIGFLYSDAIIGDIEDVEDLTLYKNKGLARVFLKARKNSGTRERGRRVLTSACGKGSMFYNLEDFSSEKAVNSSVTLDPPTILRTMKAFDKRSDVYHATGGTHSCAVCANDEILFFASDIGRHNALDKCIGYLLKNAIRPEDCYVISSGRISSDMAFKCMRANIGVVASRSATTELAIRVAEHVGITLVCFVRGSRMNIYTHPERVRADLAIADPSSST